MSVAARDAFLVDSGVGLWLWFGLSVLSLAAAIVVGLKGRWGWFWAGFVLGGIPWLVGALIEAKPGSRWAGRRQEESPA